MEMTVSERKRLRRRNLLTMTFAILLGQEPIILQCAQRVGQCLLGTRVSTIVLCCAITSIRRDPISFVVATPMTMPNPAADTEDQLT